MQPNARPWTCSTCEVDVLPAQQYCSICLRAKPLPRQGIPQIFSGLSIHFNGIIPRTLKHPSHAIEWRMAERHGANCCPIFDPSSTSILVYRPGYERSDKVRLCVERYPNIPCVPISWLLDSLLQSRQIHPVLYRLHSVPAVALPTVRGPSLPHHQHPFFVLNAEEYSLGPVPGRNMRPDADQPAVTKDDVSLLGPLEAPIPDPIWSTVSVWTAAASCAEKDDSIGVSSFTTKDVDMDQVNGIRGSSSGGIEVFTNLANSNRLNRFLFQGISVVLSESLQDDPIVNSVIRKCGGEVLPPEGLYDSATHVIYHNSDKKEKFLIEAAFVATRRKVVLATSTWLEDCLMLGELLPPLELYVPTQKLLATLAKKREKKSAGNV